MLSTVVLLATAVLFGQARPLLDVPYVAQTPELCGGAAVSMVMRYWGARDVIPEDFQSLVVRSERGIPTTALTGAVRDRQWQTQVGAASAEAAWPQLESHIQQGRPVIALIEVGPDTYHYVVVVGLTASQIVWHDPARAPFRVGARADFERAWATTEYWSVLVLPPALPMGGVTVTPPVPAPAVSTVAVTPCAALVERGVDLALAGQSAEAEAALMAATGLCPLDAAAWRELAGLRFTQSRWADAARLAAIAVDLAGDDAQARQLLATSLFLDGDLGGALRAWTPLGEPRVDAITVTGAVRMTHPAVIAASGLQARRLLTAAMWQRTNRRVSDIPSVLRGRVAYVPTDAGLADVNIAVVEHPVAPSGWVPLGVLAARTVASQELRLDVYGALSQGDWFSGSWRWTSARARGTFGAAFPAPAWLTGVVSLEALWERQTYAVRGAATADTIRESRRRAVLQVSDWASGRVRWHVGLGTDRFDGRGHATGEVGLELRVADDRASVAVTGHGWAPFRGSSRVGGLTVLAAARSTAASNRPVWLLSSALEAVSRDAARAVWPAAGTGGRGRLLRAHPLVVDHVVQGPAFGRRMSSTTAEYWHQVREMFGRGIAVAAFVDGARAWEPRGRWYLDAGVGVRLTTPGGTARLDMAHGLRGGGLTWSAGWITPWPSW